MSEPRGFVTEAPEPPQVVQDERVEGTIISVQKVEGQYGKQFQFEVELMDGYKTRCWIKHYDKPSTNTDLGKLGLTIMRRLNRDINSIDEAVDWLTHFGRVYLECKGYRNYEGKSYPKFKIITGMLPDLEPKQNTF